MSELKLLIWESDERILFGSGEFRCVLCGQNHFSLRVGCMFYQVVEDGLPRKKGDVCLYCLIDGQETAVKRTQEQAERIMANTSDHFRFAGKRRRQVWAAEQMALAKEIDAMSAWATPLELEEARSAIAEVEAMLEE